MSKMKDPDYRKQLASIFIKLAEKIEQDEQFAGWLFEGTCLIAEKSRKSKAGPGQSNEPVTAPMIPDVIAIFSKEGPDALRERLNGCELDTLREIVLANGWDPAKKVRKWKTKHKIVAYIVDTVSKQMSKGKAFLD
ncbi:hypothetical protein [Paenibacillus cremeus]|uniref:Uncharacterized protein n=1 Tax=Paenibacillus cremeus TaxID=2163881 RepID=A0A559K943_9BACL|nr:hypothetical protein [Paenibacillus cremeus]TVY08650.1 hypothetical protein FPZ49_17655 [Paenibacillus cremeus]